MNNLVIASTEADAAAATAVEQHHAQLTGALGHRVDALVGALVRMDGDEAFAARDELVAWSRAELVPHALAEEATMYPVAQGRPEARLLVEAMLAEHGVLLRLVDEISAATDVVRAGAAAGGLLEVFNSHLAKENDLLLPLLASAPEVSLVELVQGMHELLDDDTSHGHGSEHAGAREDARSDGCGGHTCSCGEADGPGYPVLDARGIPHAIRHSTIFGALDAIHTDSGMVLVAPHDPLPLLGQVEQRYPHAFRVEYLERGPEVWRIVFARRAA